MKKDMINLSNTYPRYFILYGLFISFAGAIYCLYGIFDYPFSFFNVIGLLFAIPIYLIIDNFLHLANAQIDDNYIYLKGLFFTKKIDLKDICEVKQKKWRLKRYNEPLIVIKGENIKGYLKRFYIIPNNVSYDKKVDSKIFDLLNDHISKAKINNR